MPEKRVSEYFSMTVKELKAELRTKRKIVSGKKKDLVARLMLFDCTQNNVSVVFDQKYEPTQQDRKFGIVSNLPWEYQNKVCDLFATKLELVYRNRTWLNEDPRLSADARGEFTMLLRNTLAWCPLVSEEIMLYTGYNHVIHTDDYENWTWEADEEGRVFVEIIVDKMVDMWEQSLRKHQREVQLYGNPDWMFRSPFEDIAKVVKQLVYSKVLKHQKQEKLKKLMKTTFLYGCATQTSGSTNLPLIGARYAYGPIRKQIAQYVGAVDA